MVTLYALLSEETDMGSSCGYGGRRRQYEKCHAYFNHSSERASWKRTYRERDFPFLFLSYV